MGVGTRKMEYRKMLFTKEFKQPMKKVAKAMPVGFTNEDFYEAYKKCIPILLRSLAVISVFRRKN